jgi:Smg protein
MFDILMYLFENFVHNDIELLVDQDELTDELIRAGFDNTDIIKAISWLEKLVALQESDAPKLYHHSSKNLRVYTNIECKKIDTESRGFLLFLEQASILNAETRELVIDRLMELDHTGLCVEDIKWVVLMVLFNVPDNENACAHMEDLLFELPDSKIH